MYLYLHTYTHIVQYMSQNVTIFLHSSNLLNATLMHGEFINNNIMNVSVWLYRSHNAGDSEE